MRALLLTALLASGAFAADKNDPAVFLDGTTFEPMGALAHSDLQPDLSFDGDSLAIADFNDGQSNVDVAYRVFPAAGGGYWVAGQHGTSGGGGINAAIAKVTESGSPDTSYNGNGKRVLPTVFEAVEDVAIGLGDTLYFAGWYTPAGFTDRDFGVLCVDSDGLPCAGFGTAGFIGVSFDLGDPQHRNDFATRVIAAYGSLYLAGTCDTGAGADNFALCVTKLSATTGAIDGGFGTGGHYSRNLDLIANGKDAINDLVAYSPAFLQVRLVMVGDVQRSGTDIDGFITSIDGITGADQTLFGGAGFATVAIDLPGNLQDSLTRVIRRANGSFLAAGHATRSSATPTQYEMVLVAYRTDGQRDSNFGPGIIDGVVSTLVLSGRNQPFDLVERPGNRDIVVGLNINDDLFGDGHSLLGYAQYSRSGRTQHAVIVADPPAAVGQTRASHGNDLIFDNNRIVSAGFRRWSQTTNDNDMIVVRQRATDSIFANQFGGASAD